MVKANANLADRSIADPRHDPAISLGTGGPPLTIPLGLNGATIPRADIKTGIRVANGAGFSSYEPRVAPLVECEEKGSRDRAVSALRRSGLT